MVVRADSHEELLVKINKEFINLQTYLEDHHMKINANKTQVMFINNQTETPVIIGNTNVKPQQNIKILGLNISNDLKQNHQIWEGPKSVVRALNSKTQMIRGLRHLIPQKALAQVAGSLVNSTLLYGAPVWGATTTANIDRLQKAQMKAARAAYTTGKRGKITHRQDILDSLCWPNVKQIIMTSTLNLLKSISKNESSHGLINSFSISNPKNPRSATGQRIDHKGPKNRTNTSFSTNSCMMHNLLPVNLKDKEISTKTFKQQIKLYSRTVNRLPKH